MSKKIKLVGFCSVKIPIEKGSIHYASPDTETKLGEEYIYLRKYSEFQIEEKGMAELIDSEIPDMVEVYYKNGDLLIEMNCYSFGLRFEIFN